MNAREIAIRIFARGGAAAATEFNKPASAVKRVGDELDKTAARGASASRRTVSHAQQMRGAFLAVAFSATTMAARVQSGTTSGAHAVGVMTRQVERLDRAMQRAKDQGDKFGNVKEGLGKVGTAGMVATGAAAAGGYTISQGLALAGQKELELKSIEAFEGSKAKANQIYGQIDAMSTQSVYELPDLMAAGKDLSKNRIFSQRYLRASDDLAAANKANGVDVKDVTNVYGRLKSGDFGEAFERARDFGISRKDLEAQGLKFSKSNQFLGTSEQAIEGFTKAIEAKFKGLSEKLATETMAGALSNLSDAAGRAATSISEVLVPSVTVVARWLTAIGGVFSNLPGPIKSFLAWGGVIGVVVLGLAGGLLMLAAMLGQAALGVMALTGTSGIAATTTAALAGAAGAEAAAAGTATVGTQALTVSLITGYIPAVLTTIGVLALVVAAVYMWCRSLEMSADASKMSSAELRKHWGVWGQFIDSLGNGINSIFDWFKNRWASLKGIFTGNDTSDNGLNRRYWEEENKGRRKRGQAEISWEDFQAQRAKADKISDGDVADTRGQSYQDWKQMHGDTAAPSSAPDAAPNSPSNSPGAPSMADLQKQAAELQKQLAQQPATTSPAPVDAPLDVPQIELPDTTTAAASVVNPQQAPKQQFTTQQMLTRQALTQQPATTSTAAAAPVESGSGISANVSTGGDVDSLQEQIMLTEDADKKKSLRQQLFYARRADRSAKNAERDRKAQQRATEREDKAQKKAHDKALKTQQREADKAARVQEAQQKRIDAELEREQLDALRDSLGDQVKAGLISKAEAARQIRAAQTANRRRKLGLGAIGSMGSLLGNGGMAEMGGVAGDMATQNTPAISKAEAPWLGYTRQSVGQLSKEDAFKFINRSSARFEQQGGFQGEAEMSAWQRAFIEKYGATQFANSMFKDGQGSGSKGRLAGLTDFLKKGGSLKQLKDGQLPGLAPGALSDAATPFSFGDGSTNAGSGKRPQSGNENRNETLTVQARNEVIERAGQRILKIIVPDVTLGKNEFATAVSGVKRR